MSKYQLAQLNVAALKAPLDSPELKDFVDNLDRINALAEQSPGFVWRLKGDGNDATSLRPLGDNVLVNMSVWRDVDALRDYVYKSAHVEIMRRKREWFTRSIRSAVRIVVGARRPRAHDRRGGGTYRASARTRSHGRSVHVRRGVCRAGRTERRRAVLVQGRLPGVKPRFFATPEKFRAWLAKNHATGA